jgi:hypothetical protein
MAGLQQQEEALLERQGQEHRAAEVARAALALAPQVRRIAARGTVEEKRTFLRAFVHGIEFDPESRRGVASFYAVPALGSGGGPARGGGTRSEPATTDSGDDGAERPPEGMSSLPMQNVGARYTQKRTAPGEGGSSLIMVAGAGFEPATSGL